MAQRSIAWLKANMLERDPYDYNVDVIDSLFPTLDRLITKWYVNGATGSDNNAGTDPSLPKATIQSAITALNATINWSNTPPYTGQHWIIVAPGVYAENLTPPYYARIIGQGMAIGGDVCVNIEPTTGSPLAGTGLGLHLYNLRFTCNTAVPVLDFGTMNSCLIEACMIVDGNPGLATVGIDTTGSGGSKIIGCNITHTANSIGIGIRSTGNFFDGLIQGNRISAITTGIDFSGAALVGGTVIADNFIWGGEGNALATGIDDSVVGNTLCVNNYIVATDAINHAASSTRCIGNHVINGSTGAMEHTGT